MDDYNFKKGRKKTGGRKKGTVNKNTVQIKAKVEKLLEEYYTFDMMKADLALLSPKDRLGVITGLIEYIIPKQQRKELVNEEGRVFTVNLRPAKKKK